MRLLTQASPMRGFLMVVLLAAGLGAFAQSVPPLINYQGQLANPDGSPLPTADYTLTFNLYNTASGGNPIWGPEVFDGTAGQGHGPKIPVVQGYFNVMLGPSDTAGQSLATAFDGSDRYLEIKVGGNNPIAPRQRLLTAPFAFKAANADKLASYDWASLLSANDPVNGKLAGSKIATDSLTSAQIANDAIGNVELQNNAISTAKLQDGAVVNSKLADSSVNARTLQGGAVGTGQIADGALVNSKIGDAAVSTRTIQNSAVTSPILADGAVQTAKVADQQITTAKLTDGAVTSTKLGNAAVGLANLQTSVTSALVPAGTIVAFGGGTPPTGWLLCDGAAVSRATYASLWGAIGTAWGAGNGSSTFNPPDLRGVFLRGVNGSRTGQYADPGDGRTSSAVGSFQGDDYKNHNHVFQGTPITTHGYNAVPSTALQAGDAANWNSYTPSGTITFTGGQETRPKNAYVNYIIKY